MLLVSRPATSGSLWFWLGYPVSRLLGMLFIGYRMRGSSWWYGPTAILVSDVAALALISSYWTNEFSSLEMVLMVALCRFLPCCLQEWARDFVEMKHGKKTRRIHARECDFAFNLRFPGQYIRPRRRGRTTITSAITTPGSGGMSRAIRLGWMEASVPSLTQAATH